MSSLSYSQRNIRSTGKSKDRLGANSFNVIVTLNTLAGFYLILVSFRHLADHSTSLDFVTVSLFQAVMLLTLTVAAQLVRNVAGQKVAGMTITIIPWIPIIVNAILSYYGNPF